MKDRLIRREQAVIFAAACIGVLLSGSRLYRIAGEYEKNKSIYEVIQRKKESVQEMRKEKEDPVLKMCEMPEDLLTLSMKKINEDYAGWLKISGTKIDYPVVKEGERLDYLKYSFSGKESIGGCLFISNVQEGFDEGNTVIYGHNMKDGSMFGSLKKYLDPEFYKEHSKIELLCQGEERNYQIFSVRILKEGNTEPYMISFNEESYRQWLEKSQEQSIYEMEKIPDTMLKKGGILTLSTCYGTNRRFIVQAYRQ